MFSAATQTISADHDEGDDLLQPQRAEQLAVLLHPVGGQEARAGRLLDLAPDRVRVVEIVHLEADDRDQIGLAEQSAAHPPAG